MAENSITENATSSPQSSNGMPNSLLLVFLTRLSPSEEKKLVKHLQPPKSNFQITTWSPDDQVLRSIAPQGQYRDSKANLYGLAILLHRSGRSHFIVADDLTKRQLDGRPVRGEPADISVVKVSVRPGAGEEVRVIARRSAMAAKDNASLLEAVKTFEVSQRCIGVDDLSNDLIYIDYGMQLYDADKCFFTPDTTAAGSLGHEEIARGLEKEVASNMPLPTELVREVAARANIRNTEPSEFPVEVDLRRVLNIFLAFRTGEKERKELQDILKEAVGVEFKKLQEEHDKLGEEHKQDCDEECYHYTREPEVHLIPWNQDRPMSRRDAMTIQSSSEHREIDILMEPLRNRTVDEAKLATIFYPSSALAAVRSTLKDLVKDVGYRKKNVKDDYFTFLIREGLLMDSNKLEVIPSRRIFSSYDDPFYSNPPPWHPTERTANHISLFYMTNHLTEEQDRAIWDEIYTMNDIDEEEDEKVICPVPWKPGEGITEDAPLDFMLDAYETVPDDSFCTPPYFFVDQQSGVDQTIIVMERDHYYFDKNDEKARELLENFPDPSFRGVQYARIPGRDAHTIYANLSISNMNLEEFESRGEIMKIPRPGWPGHGILFDEEELEAMDKEGEDRGEEELEEEERKEEGGEGEESE